MTDTHFIAYCDVAARDLLPDGMPVIALSSGQRINSTLDGAEIEALRC
jgi:hypothetical protein